MNKDIKRDLVSVIVPVYNVEKYIDRCIKSILRQTYKEIELILVDDGSPDNSGKICDKYGESENVKVVHQKNMGLSGARNTGLDIASGEWITFVDSDDFIAENYVACLHDLCKNNEVLISQCGVVRGREETIEGDIMNDGKIWEVHDLYCSPSREYRTIACAKMYHRSLFESLRFPLGKINEDEDVVFKLLYLSKQIVITHSHLYYYYMSEESISRSRRKHINYDFIDIFEDRLSFLKEKNENEMIEVTLKELCLRIMLNYTSAVKDNIEKKELKQFFLLYKKYYRSFRISNYSLKERIALFIFRYYPGVFAFVENNFYVIKRAKYKREKK